MELFDIKFGKERLITPTGLAAVGVLVNLTDLSKRLNKLGEPKDYEYENSDCVISYLGILCQGKSDFEDILEMKDDPDFFAQALGIKKITSPETLRQRMDELAIHMIGEDVVLQENSKLLAKLDINPTPCFTGHIPLDIDVSPHDNSKTKKEGIGWTYKGFDGFAPIYSYLGKEGYLAHVEFREGDAHCQCETDKFLEESIKFSRTITKEPLLLRMDSGNDSIDNIKVCIDSDIDFVIKRNLRKESLENWLAEAKENGKSEMPREGKTVYYGSVYKTKKVEEDIYRIRIVYQITERTSLHNGQLLLIPEIDVETWWTSLDIREKDVIELYHQHATCEQFHSEIKTDMDLERFPSSKFDTNTIILQLAAMAYNILRIIGQVSLELLPTPRKKVKRLRIKTVIQNLIQIAGHIVSHARKKYINLGRSNIWRNTFAKIYQLFVGKYKAIRT